MASFFKNIHLYLKDKGRLMPNYPCLYKSPQTEGNKEVEKKKNKQNNDLVKSKLPNYYPIYFFYLEILSDNF